jgi:hypothetical protein
MTRVAGGVSELEQQALAHVPRADAGRPGLLDRPHDGGDALARDPERGRDVVDLRVDEAVLVQAPQQVLGDGAVALCELQVHLGAQRLGERRLGLQRQLGWRRRHAVPALAPAGGATLRGEVGAAERAERPLAALERGVGGELTIDELIELDGSHGEELHGRDEDPARPHRELRSHGHRLRLHHVALGGKHEPLPMPGDMQVACQRCNAGRLSWDRRGRRSGRPPRAGRAGEQRHGLSRRTAAAAAHPMG